MLHVVESTKPLTQLTADLERAVTRHKFGVLGVHDLKAKMAEKGVPFARECRISVYEEGERTKLATIRPTALIGLYPNPELRGVAEEVEGTLIEIMAEAAR